MRSEIVFKNNNQDSGKRLHDIKRFKLNELNLMLRLIHQTRLSCLENRNKFKQGFHVLKISIT